MREVLGGLSVTGVRTNLGFLRWLVSHPQVEMGNLSTRFIERYYRPGAFAFAPVHVILAGAAVRLLSEDYGEPGANPIGVWQANAWRQARQGLNVTLLIEGHSYSVTLSRAGGAPDEWLAVARQAETTLTEQVVRLKLRPATDASARFDRVPPVAQVQLPGEPLHSIEYGWGPDDTVSLIWEGSEYLVRAAPPHSTERLEKNIHLRDEDSLESPMPGKVLRVLVAPGDAVEEEQPLVIIEAMKMEFTVRAPHDGSVLVVKYSEGDQVAVGDILVELDKN
jgi:3-methylcrotonyl-CoA carboxylase alpha subunit